MFGSMSDIRGRIEQILRQGQMADEDKKVVEEAFGCRGNAAGRLRLQRRSRHSRPAYRRRQRVRRWRRLPCRPRAHATPRLARRGSFVAAQLQPRHAEVGGAEWYVHRAGRSLRERDVSGAAGSGSAACGSARGPTCRSQPASRCRWLIRTFLSSAPAIGTMTDGTRSRHAETRSSQALPIDRVTRP